MGFFFYYDLHQYLNFETLKTYREQILEYKSQHTALFILIYTLGYIAVVAFSIPGATIMTLLSGFVFGLLLGTLVVVLSATIGAVIIFLAVQLALRDWVAQKAGKWITMMADGFKKNDFSYLLFLRLVPLFPFWLVNIVPAFLGVSLRTYTIATFIGIMPGTAVYVWVGSGLGYILDANESPNVAIIFDPKVLMPLIALGLLSLLPVLHRFMKARRQSQQEK